MILDLNMWKNQIFYDPFSYGQYTDSEDHIYTVCNRTWLKNATEEMLTYAWRFNNTNPWTNVTYGLEDIKTNSKYIGYSLSVKGIAFGPSIFAFVLFGFLAKKFSRDDEEAKRREKPFVVIKEEDEDDWYMEDEETAERNMPRRNHRFSEDQRIADQKDVEQMELKPFGKEGRGYSMTANAGSPQKAPGRLPDHEEDDNDDDDDNGNFTLGEVLHAKKFARLIAQKKARQANSLGSLNSVEDSDNESEVKPPKNKLNISNSMLSLESGNQGSKISMSSTEHNNPRAETNDAASLPSNDSGEESDVPKELSFNALQTDDELVDQRQRGRENWNKLRDRSSLSFGELFRASNVEDSQLSLQSAVNEEEERRGLNREISSTNLLQVPDSRSKTKR